MVKEWCTVKVAARIGRRRGSPPRHHRYRERLVDGVHLSKLAFPLNHLESTVDPIERHPSHVDGLSVLRMSRWAYISLRDESSRSSAPSLRYLMAMSMSPVLALVGDIIEVTVEFRECSDNICCCIWNGDKEH